MKKHVYIGPQTISTKEKSGFPQDISFWQPLWAKFSRQASTMDIHCWAVESEARVQLGTRMKEVGQVQGTKTIAFQAELTEEIIDWMSTESFDKHGGLKWFSIFLYDSFGELVLIVGHYGGEVVFYLQQKAEIDEVKSFFEGDFTIHVYD
ncbi:hypothetical protein [Sporosarcina beigongshangi]|uniref:hypothetical protein n=1 Tax=Sporosarcina beigongshangi TaxID=2782538 RepID=UPI00193988F7|nr:hypothetical protein [Sporosarcina beigongshangi]